MKRFEEDHDVVTIYFDKLTNEVTCISFTVVRKNVVDRLEPANVKLYDYYQQELTISKVNQSDLIGELQVQRICNDNPNDWKTFRATISPQHVAAQIPPRNNHLRSYYQK